jgi:hypothetical protein
VAAVLGSDPARGLSRADAAARLERFRTERAREDLERVVDVIT